MIRFQLHLLCEGIPNDFDPYAPFLDFQKQLSLPLFVTVVGNYFFRCFIISIESQSLGARVISYLFFIPPSARNSAWQTVGGQGCLVID